MFRIKEIHLNEIILLTSLSNEFKLQKRWFRFSVIHKTIQNDEMIISRSSKIVFYECLWIYLLLLISSINFYLHLTLGIWYHLYRVYQGFRLNLGKRREIIIFGSLLTTFNVSNKFWVGRSLPKIGLSLNPNQGTLTPFFIFVRGRITVPSTSWKTNLDMAVVDFNKKFLNNPVRPAFWQVDGTWYFPLQI